MSGGISDVCAADLDPKPRTSMTATARNKSMIQRLYGWTMEKSAHPHAEYWLALVSFVEASFFPIPPHPMLGLMCLADPKKAVRYALICTLRSEQHTSELQSLMRISYAVFCL